LISALFSKSLFFLLHWTDFTTQPVFFIFLHIGCNQRRGLVSIKSHSSVFEVWWLTAWTQCKSFDVLKNQSTLESIFDIQSIWNGLHSKPILLFSINTGPIQKVLLIGAFNFDSVECLERNMQQSWTNYCVQFFPVTSEPVQRCTFSFFLLQWIGAIFQRTLAQNK